MSSTPQVDPDVDRYRALFENSADAILIIEKHRFIDCNQAAVEMLGYESRSSLLQCHPSDISPEYQPDGQRSFDKANSILANFANCRSQRFEWVHVKANGESFPVEVLLTAIPADDGYTLHTVWRDISERKKLENELRHSQKMEVVGNLAGGIAHDFNNTLVPIVIYSEMLANALQDQPQLHEWACEVNRAGAIAGSLVKKLLAISRKDVRQPVILNLEETIGSLLGILRKLIGEDVTFEFQGTRSELWIEADPGDVEHIVLNLASNARDALPTGGKVTLTLRLTQRSGIPFASLEIADNGVGMDTDTLEQIFVPFFTTKELGRGTGLGLSTVRELVTKAEGQISARSSPGEGTTIEVLFPIVDGDTSIVNGAARETPWSLDGARNLAAAHILVVEDDVQISRLILRLLQQEGFRVGTAGDGTEALEILESETPDLIVTDVILPRMSGPRLVKQMHDRGIDIPVLFMSGYTDNRLAAHGFDVTKVSMVRKPFSVAMLLARVREALASTRRCIQ